MRARTATTTTTTTTTLTSLRRRGCSTTPTVCCKQSAPILNRQYTSFPKLTTPSVITISLATTAATATTGKVLVGASYKYDGQLMSSSSISSSDSGGGPVIMDCGGGLQCVPVPADRHQEVIEHLKYSFFADEPLNGAIGLCKRGEAHLELERHCLSTLAQQMSCMIVDETGKIAGSALNGIIKRGEREECERRLAELQDEKFKSIFGLLYKANEKVDLFAKYDVDELFDCRILSVDEAFRGRGLANFLVESSIRIAREAGFKVLKADATGIFSQKVFLKHGFKVITEIPYAEVDENLRPGPPHEALKLMVKILD